MKGKAEFNQQIFEFFLRKFNFSSLKLKKSSLSLRLWYRFENIFSSSLILKEGSRNLVIFCPGSGSAFTKFCGSADPHHCIYIYPKKLQFAAYGQIVLLIG